MQILGVQVRERGLGLVCGEADFVMCKESKAEKQLRKTRMGIPRRDKRWKK